MISLAPERRELWGATLGKAHLGQIQRRLDTAGYSFVLDFTEVVALSPSYLKQVFPYFLSSEANSTISPLVTGLCDDVREDLDVYLKQQSWVVRNVGIDDGEVTSMSFVGKLDSTAKDTLIALEAQGAATATELHEIRKDLGINQTAWNNRLATLADLRLAHREKSGRFWVYRPSVTPAKNG